MVRYSSDSASAADVLQDGSSIGTVQSEHDQGRVNVLVRQCELVEGSVDRIRAQCRPNCNASTAARHRTRRSSRLRCCTGSPLPEPRRYSLSLCTSSDLYLHAVPQRSNPRWRDFVANGYRHSGHRTRRWLCRAHTPDVQNPCPTQCANFVLTGCPNKVTSATQLKKRIANRFCESCKDRRAATLRLQLGQVPSFNVI